MMTSSLLPYLYADLVVFELEESEADDEAHEDVLEEAIDGKEFVTIPEKKRKSKRESLWVSVSLSLSLFSA